MTDTRAPQPDPVPASSREAADPTPAERGEARPTFEEQGLQDLRNLIRAFEPEHSSRVPKASETLAKIRALQAALAAPAAPPETERRHIYSATLARVVLKEVRESQEWQWQKLKVLGYARQLAEAVLAAPAAGEAPPADYVAVLHEAQALVRASVLWKRFIDGTPLENDIAVWMTDFALDVLKRHNAEAARRAPAQEPE